MSSSVCSLTRRAGLFVVAVFVFVFVLLWVVFFLHLTGPLSVQTLDQGKGRMGQSDGQSHLHHVSLMLSHNN